MSLDRDNGCGLPRTDVPLGLGRSHSATRLPLPGPPAHDLVQFTPILLAQSEHHLRHRHRPPRALSSSFRQPTPLFLSQRPPTLLPKLLSTSTAPLCWFVCRSLLLGFTYPRPSWPASSAPTYLPLLAPSDSYVRAVRSRIASSPSFCAPLHKHATQPPQPPPPPPLTPTLPTPTPPTPPPTPWLSVTTSPCKTTRPPSLAAALPHNLSRKPGNRRHQVRVRTGGAPTRELEV